MKRLTQLLDGHGNAAGGLTFPDHIDNLLLVIDTAKAYTVPTGAKVVNITADADFWVNPYGAAAIPAGDVTNGSGSILNPGMRSVVGVTTLSFISHVANHVSIEVFA